MTVPEYKAVDQLCEADPKHKSLQAAAFEIRDQISATKAESQQKLFKLQRMSRMIDLAAHHASLAENLDDDDSSTLKAVTGDCSECWESAFWEATEDLRWVCFDLCAEIAKLAAEIKRLEPERNAAFKRASERRDELLAEYRQSKKERPQEVAA
jgi:hypothetical protein